MAFERSGKRSLLKPRSRARFEDLPKEFLKEAIWLNKVGTFGVASAGYWCGRGGACVCRLSHYVLGRAFMIWLLLYADDEWLVGRTQRYEVGLMLHVFLLIVVNAPVAWHKVCGGIQTDLVGYSLDVGRFEIGISASRAAWVVRWLQDKGRERRVRLGELREGLGRLQFVAGPFEHLRLFLGQLYSWSCAGPRYARPAMPTMILLILKFLAEEVKRGHMSRCASRTLNLGEVFRLDAKAEGEEVAIGGWRCSDAKDTKQATWFAVRLGGRNAPWAFARGEAFRTIASLELSGVLVGIMVLLPEMPVNARSRGLISFTCGTDNQGNMFLLDKLPTTKYPLGVILMEISCQLGHRQAAMRANLIPRLQNEEGDALNSDFHHFSEDKRVQVDLDTLPLVVLRDLFEVGKVYLEERAVLKAVDKKRKASLGLSGEKAKKKSEILHEKSPW